MPKRIKKGVGIYVLMKAAAEAATNRGHDMGGWKSLTKTSAVCKCNTCGLEAVVNTKPAPNEIDVSGPAVALNCKTD